MTRLRSLRIVSRRIGDQFEVHVLELSRAKKKKTNERTTIAVVSSMFSCTVKGFECDYVSTYPPDIVFHFRLQFQFQMINFRCVDDGIDICREISTTLCFETLQNFSDSQRRL